MPSALVSNITIILNILQGKLFDLIENAGSNLPTTLLSDRNINPKNFILYLQK
jgi:hypothetical protein